MIEFKPPTPEDLRREAMRERTESARDLLAFGTSMYVETEFGPMRVAPDEWFVDGNGRVRIGKRPK